ncbi:hypothetical protein BDY24DRAFT_443963 [Mrakia frigida]|uniref:uncharacterized protein n=1 Tax=Mrakia frigida TaxID=29902 RepID=UPI003FCBFEAE
MSLDSSLPIFHLRPSPVDPKNVVELVNGAGKAVYTRTRTAGGGGKYEVVLEDALYGAHFSTVSSPSSSSKTKTILLHNPDSSVSLSLSGRLSFTWTFTWEDERYEWRQSKMSKEWTLWMMREPDPNVDVARARSGDQKSAPFCCLQSYNLQRFDTRDQKGLEIVILSSFISFIDAEQDRNPSSSSERPAASSSSGPGKKADSDPPPLPPKPNVREELGYGDFEDPPDPNEVVVKSTQSVDYYADKAFNLLNDPSFLFIILRAKSVDVIQKAVLIAEATKRLRHTRWQEVRDEEEIRQYVVEEKSLPSAVAPPPPPANSNSISSTPSKRKPPHVINLNDPSAPVLTKPPPTPPPPPAAPNHQHPWESNPISALSIYLSKIDLPDLQPKIKRGPTTTTSGFGSGRSTSPGSGIPPAEGGEGRLGRLREGLGRLGLGGSGGGGGGLRVGSQGGGGRG